MLCLGGIVSAQDREPSVDVEANPEELIVIEESESQPAATQPVVSTWDFVRMILVLGGVVGVIYLLFYLLKRGARSRHPENELIRVLDNRELSSNRALHLVEVGTNIFLVGSAESGVTLISEIKDKESQDSLRLDISQTPVAVHGRRTFSDIFAGLFRTGGGNSLAIGQTIGFLQKQKERLKKLR